MKKLPFKSVIRNRIYQLPFPLSINHQQEILAQKVIKKFAKSTFNGIDVGSHEGDYLDYFLKYSPNGNHIGFEPLPEYFEYLKVKYRNQKNIQVFNFALSDSIGNAEFVFVKNHPAYSGLQKRSYPDKNEETEILKVETDTLDNSLGLNHPVDMIKLDVEGAEMQVLKGSKKIIQKYKPLVLFEFGKGAAAYYGTDSHQLFSFFEELGYGIYTFKAILDNKESLSREKFEEIYKEEKIFNFVAKFKA